MCNHRSIWSKASPSLSPSQPQGPGHLLVPRCGPAQQLERGGRSSVTGGASPDSRGPARGPPGTAEGAHVAEGWARVREGLVQTPAWSRRLSSRSPVSPARDSVGPTSRGRGEGETRAMIPSTWCRVRAPAGVTVCSDRVPQPGAPLSHGVCSRSALAQKMQSPESVKALYSVPRRGCRGPAFSPGAATPGGSPGGAGRRRAPGPAGRTR